MVVKRKYPSRPDIEVYHSPSRNNCFFPHTTQYIFLWSSLEQLTFSGSIRQEKPSECSSLLGLIEETGQTFIHSFQKTASSFPPGVTSCQSGCCLAARWSRMVKFQMSPHRRQFQGLKARIEMPSLKCSSNTYFPNQQFATEINRNYAKVLSSLPFHFPPSVPIPLHGVLCDKKMSQCGPLSILKHRNERRQGACATEPLNDRIITGLVF